MLFKIYFKTAFDFWGPCVLKNNNNDNNNKKHLLLYINCVFISIFILTLFCGFFQTACVLWVFVNRVNSLVVRWSTTSAGYPLNNGVSPRLASSNACLDWSWLPLMSVCNSKRLRSQWPDQPLFHRHCHHQSLPHYESTRFPLPHPHV